MPWNDVYKELLRKVDQEMDDYTQQMQAKSSGEVFAHAEEIAAMRFCCDQLTEHFRDYPVEDLEYLLQFEQPLSVVCDQWLSQQDGGPTEAFGHLLWDLRDKQVSEEDYTLDAHQMRSGPTMC